MQITLTVSAGPYTGQTFTFDRPERFLIGRSNKAHFRLEPEQDKDLRVSRMHFLIEVNPPLARLHDLNSRNGTYVNGQRVTSVELSNGDEIRAGQTVLRVAIAEKGLVQETVQGFNPILGTVARPALPATTSFPPPVAPAPGSLCLCCSREPGEAANVICAACERRADEQPQPIPGYLLLRPLGKGGMGAVHLALHRTTQQPRAVKTVLPACVPQAGQLERFCREANILRELSHRRIVAFHELGEAEGMIYFAMDYVAGIDAFQFLKAQGPIAVRAAVRIITQVLQALEYAHNLRFVHRDIKPANILLERDNQRLRAKLADFGLARIYQASQLSGLTLKNDVGGTMEFMPPEQITNYRDVEPAADQFSAAATLYNLLTARFIRNLPTNLSARLDQIMNLDAIPIRERRADLSPELAAVIHRALEREPGRRYPSVAHFRKALRPFAT
jgi:serine/threonine-protein kinase